MKIKNLLCHVYTNADVYANEQNGQVLKLMKGKTTKYKVLNTSHPNSLRNTE